MKNHKFIEKKEEKWKVLCVKTGGFFYTTLWNNNTYQRNICPCCKEEIKKLKGAR